MATREFIPGDKAIWQPDDARTYQCPRCLRAVFTSDTGHELPRIVCQGLEGHQVIWDVRDDVEAQRP